MLIIAKFFLTILMALKWLHTSSKSAGFQQLESDQIHLLSVARSQNYEDRKEISAGIISDLLIFYYPIRLNAWSPTFLSF